MGCDLATVQLRRAAARLPGLAVAAADACRLPFEDGAFDAGGDRPEARLRRFPAVTH